MPSIDELVQLKGKLEAATNELKNIKAVYMAETGMDIEVEEGKEIKHGLEL